MTVYFKEEYDVHLPKMAEFLEFATTLAEVIKGMNLPYLKAWGVYQSKYKLGRFIEVWELEEQANVDMLFEQSTTHPEFSKIPPKFFEYVVPGSHKIEFLTKLASI